MPDTAFEQLLINNDLAKLSVEQRVQYYNDVCKSLGLNPLTRPFDFITLNGKLQLYAKKDATDQLRRIYQVSVNELTHDHKESLGLYIVTASGANGQGRGDSSTGAVSIKGLAGDNLANAIMKAETKAKRRLTLSLCGLGILDETEIESAQPERIATIVDGQVIIDPETQKSLAERPIEAPKKPFARKKKESVPDAGLPWGGQFSAPTTTPVIPSVAVPEVGTTNIPQESPNIHGVVIDDSEIPFPGDDEKPASAPVKDDRLPTDAEAKGFRERLIKVKDKGYMGLGQWILKASGKPRTQDIPYAEIARMVDEVEAAEKAGKLKELLEK